MTDSMALSSTSDPAVMSAMADLAEPNGGSLRYLEAAKSPATRKAYASGWRVFARWVADTYGATLPMPDDKGRVTLAEQVHPAFVIRCLTERATDRRHATLSRRLSAIRFHHHASGLASPTDHPDRPSPGVPGPRRGPP